MPSVFSFLKNMVLGKPVFTPPPPKPNQAGEQQPVQPAAPQAQAAQPTGPKTTPQAYIESVDCRESGTSMQCMATIQNYSQEPLDFDRVEILGSSFDLGTILRPGEERQFKLYDGPRVNSTGNTLCRLYFKRTADSDAFCANHNIEFEKQADNSYSISHIRFTHIQDV